MHPKIETLKAKAKAEGLWNLFLPIEADPDQRFVNIFLIVIDLTIILYDPFLTDLLYGTMRSSLTNKPD